MPCVKLSLLGDDPGVTDAVARSADTIDVALKRKRLEDNPAKIEIRVQNFNRIFLSPGSPEEDLSDI